MSQYKLVGCAPEDSAGIAKCKVSAFWSEDWWTVVFSDKRPGALSSAMAARIPYGLVQDRRLQRHQKVVHVPTGEIVGYARWILAEEAANEWLDAQVCDVSDEEKVKHKKVFDETVWEFDDTNPQSDDHIHVWQQELSPKAPHFVLDYLCCRQDHQRRGVASMLLQSGIKEADRLKMDITMVVMGLNAMALYKKNGFKIKAENQQNLEPWTKGIYYTYWVVRHPQ